MTNSSIHRNRLNEGKFPRRIKFVDLTMKKCLDLFCFDLKRIIKGQQLDLAVLVNEKKQPMFVQW